MSASLKIATLARQILDDLNAALEVGEDLPRAGRRIGIRLRSLLTLTDPSTGPVRQARLMILAAIRRTEIGDQIRRAGGCHTGAERTVDLPEDTDLELLVDGLRRLAETIDDST